MTVRATQVRGGGGTAGGANTENESYSEYRARKARETAAGL